MNQNMIVELEGIDTELMKRRKRTGAGAALVAVVLEVVKASEKIDMIEEVGSMRFKFMD